jgi:medium-chain acyl-[acyl-carrier-protein] hydrolase
MDKIKLFCFPYAGGSALIYKKWKAFFDHRIELCPIELAGRGTRIIESLYGSCEEAVEDLYGIIKPEIASSPYALFGHSMGAMLAYELARKIRKTGRNPPAHLFFSGRAAPHIPMEEEKKYHLLSQETFEKKVLELGGTPPEFFQHPQLTEMFLPLLRHDFRLAATDFDFEIIAPFDCDITVFLGKEEDMAPEQADGWKRHTHGVCSIHYFDGGHFFINQSGPAISRLIGKTLLDKVTIY